MVYLITHLNDLYYRYCLFNAHGATLELMNVELLHLTVNVLRFFIGEFGVVAVGSTFYDGSTGNWQFILTTVV